MFALLKVVVCNPQDLSHRLGLAGHIVNMLSKIVYIIYDYVIISLPYGASMFPQGYWGSPWSLELRLNIYWGIVPEVRRTNGRGPRASPPPQSSPIEGEEDAPSPGGRELEGGGNAS